MVPPGPRDARPDDRLQHQTSDAQLRIGESRDSGFDTRTRVYPSSASMVVQVGNSRLGCASPRNDGGGIGSAADARPSPERERRLHAPRMTNRKYCASSARRNGLPMIGNSSSALYRANTSAALPEVSRTLRSAHSRFASRASSMPVIPLG